ncbi:MAG: DUF1295 domain-containing protein [Ktedonobacteraceae bacterium]|nr:DUF1295 domain-containing protein [Ktedonobacteraceae bacterium]
MKQRFIVDAHKLLTTFVILLLMALYNQWDNPTAWVYLALHGTYGMLWLMKSHVFPDKRWEQTISPAYAVGLATSLTLYWLAPWILMTQAVRVPSCYIAICISLYTVGIFLHYTSDMQKYTTLRLKPHSLLNDGLWARVRNPNYLGELLIYLSFGLLTMHWLPIAYLLIVVTVIWIPNMLKKDASLTRYPQFAAYRQKTKLFLPFLF